MNSKTHNVEQLLGISVKTVKEVYVEIIFTVHCYYSIVISTENYRVKKLPYTTHIRSTYKALHR